jgi:hypothetical protein
MDTNIQDAFAQGSKLNPCSFPLHGPRWLSTAQADNVLQVHMEMLQKVQASQAPFTPERQVPIESVAKYCLFLTDKDIAPSANGSCITFSKNTPEA